MSSVRHLSCLLLLLLASVAALVHHDAAVLEKRMLRSTHPLLVLQQAFNNARKWQSNTQRTSANERSTGMGHTMARRANNTTGRFRPEALLIPWTNRLPHGSPFGKTGAKIEAAKQYANSASRSASSQGNRDISKYSRLFSISLPLPPRRSRVDPVLTEALDPFNGEEIKRSEDEPMEDYYLAEYADDYAPS